MRSNVLPAVFQALALSFALSIAATTGLASDCEIMRDLDDPKALAETTQTNHVAEELMDLIFDDPAMLKKFEANPYLAAYVHFKFLMKDPVLSKVAGEYMEIYQKELGRKDMANLDRFIEERLADAETRAKAYELIKNVASTRDVEEFRKQTIEKWAGRKSKGIEVYRQLKSFPRTLQKIWRHINKEFTKDQLDEALWSLHGFHNDINDRHYKQRSWDKVPQVGIGPRDVMNINMGEMALLIQLAMEVEAPTVPYSKISGNALRALLPNFARYMGKKAEQYEYVVKDIASKNSGIVTDSALKSIYCEGGWCAEEKRHANWLGNAVKMITGVDAYKENPVEAADVPQDLQGAFKHLEARQGNEWAASSAYFLMLGHVDSKFEPYFENILRDEIKHLVLTGAARTYLRGHHPWARMWAMTKNSIKLAREYQKTRTGGSDVNNPVTIMEIVATHLMVEAKIRQYLATIPLRALREAFDGKSELPIPPAEPISAEEQAKYDAQERDLAEKRRVLYFWDAKQQAAALAQEKFERDHAEQINSIIYETLHGFRGAEVSGSDGERRILEHIAYLTDLSPQPLWKKILIDRLRDYQIRNNRYIRAKAAKGALSNDETVGHP